MHLKAIVTGVHSPAGGACVRALRQAPVQVYAASSHPQAGGLFYLDRGARLIHRPLREGGIEAIARFCARKDIHALIPCADEELSDFLLAKEELERRGVRLLLPSSNTVALLSDRLAMLTYLSARLTVPWCAPYDEQLKIEPDQLPLWLKDRRFGERPARLLRNVEALAGEPLSGRMMLERPKQGERYLVDVLTDRCGQVLIAVPQREIEGVAYTLHDERLQTLASTAARMMGLAFVGCVEFIKVKNRYFLVDVRPRPSTGVSLSAASGVNLPYLGLKLLLGEDVRRSKLRFRELAVVPNVAERFVSPGEVFASASLKLDAVKNVDGDRSVLRSV